MKRFLSSLLVALMLVSPLQAADWSLLATRLSKATVYIELGDGSSCSGFVINDAVGEKAESDYVLTAAHCDGKDLFVDQQKAIVMTKDLKNDLMILRVPDMDRPALRLAKANAKQGDEIASFGYGYSLEQPMFRLTHVAIAEADIEGLSGKYMITDATFVPGQSGGPIVNVAGEVVAIVQMSTVSVGLGKGAETIKAKVGKYFGEAK